MWLLEWSLLERVWRMRQHCIMPSISEFVHVSANRIQLSFTTYDLLKTDGGFEMSERGTIAIKGKGACTTYWLLNKR